MCLVFIVVGALMIMGDPDSRIPLKAAVAEPVFFGHYLFQRHWLAIEIISLLLLVAVVAVLYLGMNRDSYKWANPPQCIGGQELKVI
jgi:NADH-quinone oxidoreductase subunit J